MATNVQSRRRAGPQSLFYRDLSATPSARPSVLTDGPGTPGQSAAAVALWRDNLGGTALPPPPIDTLEDRTEHSPNTTISESPLRSPSAKFDQVKSLIRTPVSGRSSRPPLGFTHEEAAQGSVFASQVLQNTQQRQSPGGPNWWSPLKDRRGHGLVVRGEAEKYGGIPDPGVLRQQLESGGLLTSPTSREVVRPEIHWSGSPDDTGIEGDEWVTVFGFPANETNAVLREFEKCGLIVKHVPGPNGANWIHIEFQNHIDARKALQKNGMQINGALIVGVKPLGPLQRQALTDKSQATGSMVLPLRTPEKVTPSALVKASARPYYLQPGKAGQAAGLIASPAKATISKIVDLVFGK